MSLQTITKSAMAEKLQQNWQQRAHGDSGMVNSESCSLMSGVGTHNVDDGLTSLNWLQNLNIMTRMGAPTPPTPPASPVPICSGSNALTMAIKSNPSNLETDHTGKNLLDPWNLEVSSRRGGSVDDQHTLRNRILVEETDYKNDGSAKPPYSYATLICMAMYTNKNKMTLSSIYKWIRENFVYYKNADPSWQNSIRHNLSLNKCFIKVPRSKDEPGKGGFWRLDPEYAESLVDGVFKKRRNTQRSASTNNSTSQGGTITGPPTSKKSKKDKSKGQLQSGLAAAVAAVTARSKAIAAAINSAKSDPTEATQPDKPEPDTPPNSTGSSFTETQEAVASIVNPNQNFGTAYEAVPRVIVERILQLDPLGPLSCQTTNNVAPNQDEEACDIGDAFRGDLCWNSILTDTELDLESFEKYRVVEDNNYAPAIQEASTTPRDHPESSGSLANMVDFFPSTEEVVGCADLTTDFGLASNVSIDGVGDLVSANGSSTIGHPDWWACFSQPGISDFLCLSQSLLNLPPLISAPYPVSFSSDAAALVVEPGTVENVVSPSSSSSLTSLTAADAVFNVSSAHPMGFTDPTLVVTSSGENRNQQPWAECKAALEAAALELESLTDLQPSNY